MIISVIKDVRAVRRSAPYGKVFKKEFAEIIDDIFRAQKISDQTYISAFTNNMLFKIEVDEYKPSGLEYLTIPMYRCYDIYINGEIVCREHIIREFSKDKIWFEFSSKRERDEIIAIINSANEHAQEICQKNNKELYERLGLVSKSFFTEDKYFNDIRIHNFFEYWYWISIFAYMYPSNQDVKILGEIPAFQKYFESDLQDKSIFNKLEAEYKKQVLNVRHYSDKETLYL